MDALYLYPTIAPDSSLLDKCGYVRGEYAFAYDAGDVEITLKRNGKKLVDPNAPKNIFLPEEKGLIIEKTVEIARPDLLKGPFGIACRDAEVGLCMMWTCEKLKQTGYVLPEEDSSDSDCRRYRFRLVFDKGEIAGNLELSIAMYIKASAELVSRDEDGLMNDVGVTVGEPEKSLSLVFTNEYMDFPVVECKPSKGEPLWWVEFSSWDDPRVDEFTAESLCLYLNPYYVECPTITSSGNINNPDMLVDILSQVYFLVIRRLEEMDCLDATIRNVGLGERSICCVMHQFFEDTDDTLNPKEPDEELLKDLQTKIRRML